MSQQPLSGPCGACVRVGSCRERSPPAGTVVADTPAAVQAGPGASRHSHIHIRTRPRPHPHSATPTPTPARGLTSFVHFPQCDRCQVLSRPHSPARDANDFDLLCSGLLSLWVSHQLSVHILCPFSCPGCCPCLFDWQKLLGNSRSDSLVGANTANSSSRSLSWVLTVSTLSFTQRKSLTQISAVVSTCRLAACGFEFLYEASLRPINQDLLPTFAFPVRTSTHPELSCA